MEMANRDQLNGNDTVASDAALENSPGLIFVFGALFRSPLKESTHLACRKHVVSVCIVSNDGSNLRMSRSRMGNCTSHAEGGCYQASCSGLCEGLPRLNFRG